MIAGVGTDIAAVARLGQLYTRHGERALEKLLAPAEMADFARASDPARFLALELVEGVLKQRSGAVTSMRFSSGA